MTNEIFNFILKKVKFKKNENHTLISIIYYNMTTNI